MASPPSVPSIDSMRDIFDTESNTVDYLMEHHALTVPTLCPREYADDEVCGGPITLRTQPFGNWKMYRCTRTCCRQATSILTGTFFENAKVPLNKVMQLALLWLSKVVHGSAMILSGLSDKTVTYWYNRLDDLVNWDFVTDPEDNRIGGPGIVVQIDESKMGKRKYNRGHRVEGVWVVGGVEETTQRKMFAISVGARNRDTLSEVIKNHVLDGSILITDCWKGYSDEDLAELGIAHNTVNHSIEFVSAEGWHTNSIEGTWTGIKKNVPKTSFRPGLVDTKLLVYIWRRKYNQHLWSRLMYAMAQLQVLAE